MNRSDGSDCANKKFDLCWLAKTNEQRNESEIHSIRKSEPDPVLIKPLKSMVNRGVKR